jgi:uncharacterized protein YybS (DUF2232 family)
VETAFLASTSALVWLLTIYFTPTEPVLRLFFPLPVALAVLRWDVRTGRMTLLVSTLLLTLLLGPTRSILYLLPYGLLGLWLGGLWQRRASWYLSTLVGTAIGTCGLIFQLLLSSLLVGENVWAYIILQLTGFVNWLLDWSLGWLGLQLVAPAWLVQLAMVGFVGLNSLVYAFTVHLVAALVMERLRYPLPKPPRWVQHLLA